MPYQIGNPPATIKNLPKGAQKVWIDTFNAVEADTKDEDQARQAAWANVKKQYKKQGDQWVPKSAIAEVSLVITKASLQQDGTMRWQATVSDTQPDQTGERTSLSLFQDWIERVETGKSAAFLPPPRVPFLGVSHYPSFEGAGEAGITEKMYIDGKQFKVSGVFLDSPLGKALFQAVRSELETVRKGGSVEQPIRISAAWWDLEHAHGKFVFTRRSLFERCPMCEKGAGDKQYLKGQPDHWASTRVPINPRTALELEEKSMAKTRKDDAASIVGDELAEELEGKAQELVGKSETEQEPALVVKAEDPSTSSGQDPEPDIEKAVTKTVGGTEYPASDFLVVEDAESPSTWHLQVKRNGKPDHRLMGAAWAALHEGYRGNKYEGPKKADALKKLTALYKSEKMETPTAKAEVEKMYNDEGDYLPFGGATTIAGIEANIAEAEKYDQLYNNWDMFTVAIGNILQSPMEDRMGAISALVKEFGDRVDALKANVSDAFLIAQSFVSAASPPATVEAGKGETVMTDQVTQEVTQVEPVVNDPAAVLGTAVKAALDNTKLSREDRLEAIQEALNSYAGAVKAELDAVAPPAPGEEIVVAIEKSMSALAEKLDLLIAKLDNRPTQPVQQAVPQQKSYTPGGPVQPQASGLPTSPVTGQPSSLRALIERSVGMHQ